MSRSKEDMPWVLYVYVTLLLVQSSSSLPRTDPCLENNHVSINYGKYRGTLCKYISGKSISDRYINGNLWYKAEGFNDSLSMPTSQVETLRCSTKWPIWMNGTHPDSGIVVRRIACLTGLTSFCQIEHHIEVKNCSGFYVYKLQKPTGGDRAYCFGEDEPCPPPDPCVDIERGELPNDGHRGATYSPTDLCDNATSGWYRVHKTGNKESAINMTDQCPKSGSCGATFPIWLEETHPTSSEGIVRRNVCVRNDTDCCGERFEIRVVNCESFFVYELKARTSCPPRYCFGNVDNEIRCLQDNDTIIDGNNGINCQDNTVLMIMVFQVVVWAILDIGD